MRVRSAWYTICTVRFPVVPPIDERERVARSTQSQLRTGYGYHSHTPPGDSSARPSDSSAHPGDGVLSPASLLRRDAATAIGFPDELAALIAATRHQQVTLWLIAQCLVVFGRNNPSPYTVNGRPLYVHLNGLAIVVLK